MHRTAVCDDDLVLRLSALTLYMFEFQTQQLIVVMIIMYEVYIYVMCTWYLELMAMQLTE